VHILNKSFSSGLLPNEWKCADITPLHKKGSKSLRENYRLISLISIVCKIGEKIVFDRLHKFGQETGLINNNQFGFLKGGSTVTQLLSSLNDWAKSRNLYRPTDVVFLDLAKAFDSVTHERLLLKLKSNGIDGCLHAWLRHFLTGRRQRVILMGTRSKGLFTWRWGDLPHVTSPIWGPPPPCKQALIGQVLPLVPHKGPFSAHCYF